MSRLSKIFRRRSSERGGSQSAAKRDADTPPDRTTNNAPVAGDNPIRRVEDDTLGRGPVARSFARQVLAVDSKEGLVVGVLGPWGSGKTSFINLARDEFKSAGVPVLDFNPWMFSGAQQLAESFFVELAAQLRIRPGLADVGKDLQVYGEAFSGMAWLPGGTWIERGRVLTKVVGDILQRRKEGIGGRRAKLQKALADLSKPIVVVVDDIDRLSTSEIRDVFKLVRLTASFPNVIYLVAFDRGRVETALAEQGMAGRDYLEKILQVAMDLPAVPDQVLVRQIISAIHAALSTVEQAGPFDDQVWPDVFMEIIRPLVRNMRDVRRYAAAIHVTVGALNGQIALPDVLALEAVRVFLPDVFAGLHGAVEALTSTPGSDQVPKLKSQIDGLITDAGGQGKVVRGMVERLFPAAQRHIGGSHYDGADWKGRWLKARRVAHEEILRLYLERAAGNRLNAFTDAEKAWACMTDRDAFNEYLRSLDPERLQDVITSLEIYEDEFALECVVPGTTVLLNLMPELPDRPQGMFELGGRVAVTRVTYRLLRSLNSADAVEAAVREILPELKSLSAKFDLIEQVGHREGRGHKLVSEMAASDFEKAWRSEVRATPVHDLAKETNLLCILLVTKREGRQSEPTPQITDAPALTLAILRAARGEVRSQAIGNRAVRRSPRLDWDALIAIYDSEETLKQRIESLAATPPEGADDLLGLAKKYLSGWRPSRFGDDLGSVME
jgi:hypothetical protein